ncbi:DUF305 domain-containing protein [Nucisporomicrobium flavum]|uniref:DUF305 domain-containing protein n=1 Tax=Nucisporomicrobium flavum TaxID=2785915 RepID=UPI0027DCAE55|nr:DUF305 domain-containing protein [Nucisporomicrobium flavum]
MGTDLTTYPGRVRGRGSALPVVAAVVLMLLAACGAAPAAPPPAYNATDVMFLQMSVEYVRQGELVVAPAAQGAADTRVRALAAELRDQWRDEVQTMQRWLTGWQQPPSADPDTGVHAGHGDLHSLRDADIGELAAAHGAAFDRTAVSLLLGHLHNCVEVARMELAGGQYPPARALAERMTAARQDQIRRLLALAAS